MAGCAAWPDAASNGLIYTDVTKPVAVLSSDTTAVRSGEACTIGLLGLFATGNSTIATARDSVGITNVVMVEERHFHILAGAFTQYCVVVSGT